MTEMFRTVISSSLYATVVGCIIVLLKGVFRHKLNAQWHYLIWIILIAKLFIPFGPQSSISVFNVIPQLTYQTIDPVQQDVSLIEQGYSFPGGELPTVIERNEVPANQRVFTDILPYTWALGAVLMLMWFVMTHITVHRQLRKSGVVTDQRLLSILADCKAALGISGKIQLVLQDNVSTPCLFSVTNPKILLSPAVSTLPAKELEYILLHELAHYQRKDVHVNYLLLILHLVHWFNPFVSFFFKRIREDMEAATDERVLSVLQATEYKDYGRTLLHILENVTAPRMAPRLLGLADDKKSIEHRIKMIKNAGSFRDKRARTFVVGLICFAVLGGILLTNGITKTKPPSSSDTYSAEALYQHRTPYVGNNSKVAGLINVLPYAGYREEISLQTRSTPYGITVNYDLKEENIVLQQMETTLQNNAAIMFALIDNVDTITFQVGGTSDSQLSYRYTRNEVQKSFVKDLRDYAKDVKDFEQFLMNLAFTVVVSPEIYTPAMSSTPGIRLLAEYQGLVAMTRYKTESGVFLIWDESTGKISIVGSSIERTENTPVYWSPINEQGQISETSNQNITITLLDENNSVMAEKRITIRYDGTYYSVIKTQ